VPVRETARRRKLVRAATKYLGAVHRLLYRASGGRIGGRVWGLRVVLLTTTGRRTGKARTVALCSLPDGADVVVIASYGGLDQHPAWWLNLVADPHATIQVGPRTLAVVARRAEGADHARLWPAVKKMNPFYAQYELITDRDIPVVILEPAR